MAIRYHDMTLGTLPGALPQLNRDYDFLIFQSLIFSAGLKKPIWVELDSISKFAAQKKHSVGTAAAVSAVFCRARGKVFLMLIVARIFIIEI